MEDDTPPTGIVVVATDSSVTSPAVREKRNDSYTLSLSLSLSLGNTIRVRR